MDESFEMNAGNKKEARQWCYEINNLNNSKVTGKQKFEINISKN